MCWSGEASLTLAAVGLTSTAYIAYKGDDKAIYLPLAYFSLMELLQAATYTVIGQCELPLNQFLTFLGMLHICFQPFFINMASMYFIPEKVRNRIAPFAYGVCFIGTGIMFLKLYPFQWAGHCPIQTEPLCAEILCSVYGNWHIAWDVPMNGLEIGRWGYIVPGFIVPILYGSWRATLYHLITGPLLASLLTNNKNEWPAIWCLLSIGLLLLAAKTPIRSFLHVRRWIWWKA